MSDCGFSVIELEMATGRDVQSARVTTTDLKDVVCTDTTKRGQKDGFSDQLDTYICREMKNKFSNWPTSFKNKDV